MQLTNHKLPAQMLIKINEINGVATLVEIMILAAMIALLAAYGS